MTPYELISEQYAIATRWTRHAPNRLIVSPAYYAELCRELDTHSRETYYGLKVLVSKDVEEFELAFVYEVTDV
jgi:hypothetical protein